MTKNSQNFDQKIEIRKRCKGVHCVDLGESFPTSIYLQNLASIQPRTSLLKFEGGGFSAPVILTPSYNGFCWATPAAEDTPMSLEIAEIRFATGVDQQYAWQFFVEHPAERIAMIHARLCVEMDVSSSIAGCSCWTNEYTAAAYVSKQIEIRI